MKTGAGAFDKPSHALATVTLTSIFEPVDGYDGCVRFAVFLLDCIQGLEFPAARRAPTGEKCHDNDLTFAQRDGGGANRWRAVKIASNLSGALADVKGANHAEITKIRAIGLIGEIMRCWFVRSELTIS